MKAPARSWDTHVHVFGPTDEYPASNVEALYAAPVGYGVDALEALHNALGIDHAVLVQPTIYGADHRYLLHVLNNAPPGQYVGVAIVNDRVSDRDLDAMHKAGVRGARFNFGRKFKLAPTGDEFRRNLSRVTELGWFVKIFGYGDDFLNVADDLASVNCCAIIDHMGGPMIQSGTGSAGFQFILELLQRPNWWVMLSNGDTRSLNGPPWSDVQPFGKLLQQAAPDRCIWGSDWPHVHKFIRPDSHESDYGINHNGDRLELLRSYLPDNAAFHRVLVENPARLFDKIKAGI